MSNLLFWAAGAASIVALGSSCGSSGSASICGAERPCIPAGNWLVSYDMTSSGQSFSSNSIRVNADGSAEVIGEEVPDNSCSPMQPRPGDLLTTATLSDDGCTLNATISKSWCQSGEANCEDRRIELDFCENGSSSTARGSLEACVCWIHGSPFCNPDDFVTAAASAVRVVP